ncbi:MAG: hypothetical protein MI807_19330 [Verrucomicrobiales bacterium]|nr:hypothetical protein [Verrucomicrobiales bacterium]
MENWEDVDWNGEEMRSLWAEALKSPVYRGEEDLEKIRNSDSPTVAVLASDQETIFFVSRERVLRGEIKMNTWDLFEHAGEL